MNIRKILSTTILSIFVFTNMGLTDIYANFSDYSGSLTNSLSLSSSELTLSGTTSSGIINFLQESNNINTGSLSNLTTGVTKNNTFNFFQISSSTLGKLPFIDDNSDGVLSSFYENNNNNRSYEINGYIQVSQVMTDENARLETKRFNGLNGIDIEYDFFSHPGGGWGPFYYGGIQLFIKGNGGGDQQVYENRHLDTLRQDWGGYGDRRAEINGNIWSNPTKHWIEGISVPLIHDKWVHHKSTIDIKNNKIIEYVNGVEHVTDIDLSYLIGKDFKLDINPYGWWTGHYVRIKNLSIKNVNIDSYPIFNNNPVLAGGSYYNLTNTNSQMCISNEYLKSQQTSNLNTSNAGDPVNLATGEFGYENTFMNIPGKKLPYEFKLSYKNEVYYDGPTGVNWDHNYNKYLVKQDNGDILYFDGQLGVFRFAKTQDGFLYNKGLKANLGLNEDLTYTLTFDSKDKYLFNIDNELSQIINKYGDTLNFTYTDKLLTKVTDTLGGDIIYNYNDDKKLIKVTDFNGNNINLNYYSDTDTTGTKNDLKSVIITNNGKSKTISFEYNTGGDNTEKHNLTKLIDAKGQIYVENTYEDDRVKTQKYGNGEINYNYTLSGSEVIQNTVIDRLGNKTDYFYKNGQNIKTLVYNQDKIINHSYTYNDLGYLETQTLPNGNGYKYSYDEKGNLIEKRQKTDLNTPDSNKDLVTSYTYNDKNEVLTQSLPNGNIITNTYNDNGNLIQSQKQVSGKTITTSFEYDNNGNLVKSISPNGNITTYNYENGLITKISKLAKNRNGVLGLFEDYKNDIITTFKYDTYGNIISKIDSNGNTTNLSYNEFNNLIKSITPEGIISNYSYDENNNLIQNNVGLEDNQTTINYNLLDKPTEIISKIDKDTTSEIQKEYDNNDNLVKIILDNQTSVNFTYDNFNNITKKVVKDNNNNSIITTYNYDNNGNVLSETNDLNQTIKYEYDLYDRVIKKVFNNGNYDTYNYDKVGNILQTLSYSSVNKLLSKQSFTYDENNQIIQKINYNLENNSEIITKYEYDLEGNLLKEYDANSNSKTYTYDEFNRVVNITDALGNKQSYIYDKNGNIIQKTLIQSTQKTIITKYVYDKDNRVIAEVNNLGIGKGYKYNLLNQIIELMDENGNSTTYEYNYLGKITKKLENVTTNGTKSQIITNYTYDSNQNLTSIVDGNGNKTTYVYDAFNRLIKTVYSDNKELKYTYDNIGNLLTQTDPNGSITTNTYDNLNRLIEKNIKTGSGVIGTIKETYLYDDLGRLITSENLDNSGSISKINFEYNSLNQLISETNNGNKISYEYDLNGNLVKTIYPSGKIVTKSYDELNRLVNINIPHPTPLLTGEGIKRISINYNYSGLELLNQINSNNTKITYSYDELSRLKELNNISIEEVKKGKTTSTQENIINNLKFTYDNIGNITGNGIENYSYDEISRLTNVNIPDINITNDKKNIELNTSYLYDNAGNRNSVEQTTTWETKKGQDKQKSKIADYTTNALNQYTSVESYIEKDDKDAKKNKVTNYVYDNNGNLIQDNKQKYFYDYRNRLVKVEKLSKNDENDNHHKDENNNKKDNLKTKIIAEYAYDTLGRRLQKTIFDDNKKQVTKYTYAGNNAIVEESYEVKANKLKLKETKENIYSNSVDDILVSIIAKDGKTKIYFYNKNQLGSITSITDEKGKIVEEYKYDVFGKAYTRDGKSDNFREFKESKIGNIRLFTGREFDKDINKYYYRARYYDAESGRFISRDPIGQVDNVNLHSYVGDNPVNFVDPSGESSKSVIRNFTLNTSENYLGGHQRGREAIKRNATYIDLNYKENSKYIKTLIYKEQAHLTPDDLIFEGVDYDYPGNLGINLGRTRGLGQIMYNPTSSDKINLGYNNTSIKKLINEHGNIDEMNNRINLIKSKLEEKNIDVNIKNIGMIWNGGFNCLGSTDNCDNRAIDYGDRVVDIYNNINNIENEKSYSEEINDAYTSYLGEIGQYFNTVNFNSNGELLGGGFIGDLNYYMK